MVHFEIDDVLTHGREGVSDGGRRGAMTADVDDDLSECSSVAAVAASKTVDRTRKEGHTEDRHHPHILYVSYLFTRLLRTDPNLAGSCRPFMREGTAHAGVCARAA